MPAEPTPIAFCATRDVASLGIRAGDRFLWQQTGEGSRLRQIRDWKNPVSLLELFSEQEGLLQPLGDGLAPPARQAVAGLPDRPGPPYLTRLK
jgi:hypothetical protein